MYISRVQIKNYKSFYATEEIPLSRGFNVVVGQNDAGKTAFIEALGLQFNSAPHRSLNTVPKLGSKPDPISEVIISFTLTVDEVRQLSREISEIRVLLDRYQPTETQVETFLRLYSEERSEIRCVFQGNHCVSALFSIQSEPKDTAREGIHFTFNGSDLQPIPNLRATIAIEPEQDFGWKVATLLSRRIYTFKAERFNVGEFRVGPASILFPNAQNLAQVLHTLQASNPNRFVRFNSLVTLIFPHIKQITTPLVSEDNARILIWPIDPASERADLAIPLSESGTGIGQVLAILYVVLTEQEPRTIIIDEPQSFLHPGAIRKLFDILKDKDHAQHQYIVTTHSPTVITSASTETLFLVRKTEAESSVTVVDGNETQQLSLFLAEIGARLSDVFGADNILWVEGRTEEVCFPAIVAKILKRPLLDTVILGVLQTGDFEGKHSKAIFEIYQRLSAGRGILPPAIAFIFDREERSERDRTDLERQSKGVVKFTSRRMYENYLLNPEAIASVVSQIENFRKQPIAHEEVQQWIEEKRKTIESLGDSWINDVHAARMLDDIFSEFSEGRVRYDKVQHGLALTNWIADNSPEDLSDIKKLLEESLDLNKTKT